MTESEPTDSVVTPDEPEFADLLRTVFGHFATGVTVITAVEGEEPIGLAVNSFTSVSLDPPLVLFCASASSATWPRIQATGAFTVNVLSEHQEHVSRAFAARGSDRFSTIGWRRSAAGSPILHDVLAYVDCRIEHEYPGGDHVIVVGRVLDLGVVAQAGPLVFFRSGYGRFHDSVDE